MRKLFLLLLMPITFQVCAQLDHASFDRLLKKHVSEKGTVNYEGFKQDRAGLQGYLSRLKANAPQPTWSDQEKLAYWINAYNAWTIWLIVENQPLESIQDIKSPWQQKIVEVGDQVYSLDYLENSIIRGNFQEPRIHFAVNCASKSCPPLRNEAYRGDRLYMQLDEQARRFINDPSYNQITAEEAHLSKIFDWYKEDFLKQGDLISYLRKYADPKPSADAKISYLKYDWSLND